MKSSRLPGHNCRRFVSLSHRYVSVLGFVSLQPHRAVFLWWSSCTIRDTVCGREASFASPRPQQTANHQPPQHHRCQQRPWSSAVCMHCPGHEAVVGVRGINPIMREGVFDHFCRVTVQPQHSTRTRDTTSRRSSIGSHQHL